MTSDLRDLIARYREQTSGLPDDDRVSITAGEARALITAAEASLSARNSALEEAAKAAETADNTEFLAWRAGCCDVIATAIRALKEPT